MDHLPIQAPLDLVRPDYNIYRYTDQIYKIIRFRTTAVPTRLYDRSKFQKYDCKIPAALSRARRVVLELALCNSWDWFCTFTISKSKYDRSDLMTWRKSFTQWIRDQRKKGLDISYLLVPEQHKDGSWHMHGFFCGVSDFLVSFADERKRGLKVPDKLVKGNFYDWPDYREKFGFCSFGAIRDPVAAGFYVVKYLTKDLHASAVPLGLSLYYCSQGLNRADFHGDIYGSCAYLNQFLTNKYDFCETGMTKVKDNVGWDFALEHMDILPLEDVSAPDDSIVEYVDFYAEITQLSLDGFSDDHL